MSTSSSHSSGTPTRRASRRLAATWVAASLTAGPAVLLGAAPAHATGDHGTSGAAILRADLNVGLLHKTAEVPLKATLNEVHAPASAEKTALSVQLDGVNHGKSFNMLRANVATARATADGHKTEGYANLEHAEVHLPALASQSLLEVKKVTSKAICTAGERPRAESNILGTVRVLGKEVTLRADGTKQVKVPGVGEVRLDLSKKSVTSKSAAATALDLNVSVNPLKLNVADVKGHIKLAEASCTTGKGSGDGGTSGGSGGQTGGGSGGQTGGGSGGQTGGGSSGGSGGQAGGGSGGQTGGGSGGSGGHSSGGQTGGSSAGQASGGASGGGNDTHPQTGTKPAGDNLAETGSSSATPYLAGGAALLLFAGAGSLGYARRRRNAAQGG
ncbi:SCO1860 family LAETG-anchored protein [Streptomyces halobius]|uniref:LPXTG cell wall anchor domain-containing protein n=1 Tax=Streptomyces halobius TaxID=2879846 RepID=A0ABY4MFK9_9ACTN|nr:SCO1860 family LAETG-anchored protein [Streptomyces halobius]UQA96157.1 LPXTG cell wall anchor domain-containing protein [Streptomyces halobius]